MSEHSDDERFESDRPTNADDVARRPGERGQPPQDRPAEPRADDRNAEDPEDAEDAEDPENAEDTDGPVAEVRGDGDGVPRYRRELPAEVAAEQDAAEPAPRRHVHEGAARQEQAGSRVGGSAAEGKGPSAPEARESGRTRLAGSLWPPRLSRAQLIVAVLLAGLGFGLAVQVASTTDNSALRGARQEDLVRILDELDDRTQRLEDEKRRLENQRTGLENSSDQAEEARRQTLERERQLGILAGTVAAEGPGITVTVEDPKKTVEADMLLDAVQELRAAGAEAIQINDVRVVADTYLSDASGGGVAVDGNKIKAPYRFQVIGKPEDLGPALNIPGGVVQTLEKEQAEVTVEDAEKVVVDALRRAEQPDYARPSSR